MNRFEEKEREKAAYRGMILDLRLHVLDKYTRDRLLKYAEQKGFQRNSLSEYWTKTGVGILIDSAKVLHKNMSEDETQPGERLTDLSAWTRIWEHHMKGYGNGS